MKIRRLISIAAAAVMTAGLAVFPAEPVNAEEESKLIALTFDDGPNTTTTCEILDILEENDAKATFFLIGRNINEESAASVKRAYDMGCEIGNHSKSHLNMPALSDEEILEEIQYVEDYVTEITGEGTKYFRAPFIDVNDKMYELIDQIFICGIGCSDYMDTVTADDRYNYLMEEAKDGQIFLFHDAAGNDMTVEAVKKAIPELKAQGYEFVTLSELFERQGETPKDYVMYDRVAKYPCSDYTLHSNVFTGEVTGDSSSADWSNVGYFDAETLASLGDSYAIQVDYVGSYPPNIVLQRWTGESIWCPIEPAYSNGERACIMAEDILAALEEYGVTYTDLDRIRLFPYMGSITVTSIDIMVKSESSVSVSGDVNSDGRVSVADAVALQKHLVDENPLDTGKLDTADVDADGIVNVLDLSMLKLMITGA